MSKARGHVQDVLPFYVCTTEFSHLWYFQPYHNTAAAESHKDAFVLISQVPPQSSALKKNAAYRLYTSSGGPTTKLKNQS